MKWKSGRKMQNWFLKMRIENNNQMKNYLIFSSVLVLVAFIVTWLTPTREVDLQLHDTYYVFRKSELIICVCLVFIITTSFLFYFRIKTTWFFYLQNGITTLFCILFLMLCNFSYYNLVPRRYYVFNNEVVNYMSYVNSFITIVSVLFLVIHLIGIIRWVFLKFVK